MWLLQSNIWKEEKYDSILSLLDRYCIEYKVVNIIPFSTQIDADIDFSKINMVFGSVKMTELCQAAGCNIFYGELFDYKIWSDVFRESCLNPPSENILTNIGRIEFPIDTDMFIRPVLDDKSFSGQILQIGDTLNQIRFATSKNILDIEVICCPIKKIYSEYRCAVVDNKVVTASMYKFGNRVHYTQIDANHVAYTYAQELVDKWTPAPICVIDVADTPDGLKLVEFGCIHNCGFYDLDLSKMIQEIELYFSKAR